LRGPKVVKLFGPGTQQVEQQLSDNLVKQVMETGQAKLKETDGKLRFIYPIKAEEKCLSCHSNSVVGEINGMIDVRFPVKDLRVPLEFMLESIFQVFIFIFVIAAIVAFIVMRKWLIKPLKELANQMREIDILEEMDADPKDSKWTITEIRTLTEEFHYLLHKQGTYQKKLQERSARDALTGLYNRRHLEEQLEKELARSKRYHHSLGLLMIDLNHFKPINDNYGHEAGDKILLAVSQAMQGQLRTSDLLARVGGDEFMIIAPESSDESIQILVDKICSVVASTIVNYEDESLSVSASVGVSVYPRDGDSCDLLKRTADNSMYETKKSWHVQQELLE